MTATSKDPKRKQDRAITFLTQEEVQIVAGASPHEYSWSLDDVEAFLQGER